MFKLTKKKKSYRSLTSITENKLQHYLKRRNYLNVRKNDINNKRYKTICDKKIYSVTF